MEYDIDYFIEKVKSTPAELFCIGGQIAGKACINYQCNQEERMALRKLFDLITVSSRDGLPIYDTVDYSNKAAYVNNGYCKEYKQETIPERLLAVLYDIKAARALSEAKDILNAEIILL